ncbi:MAG: signal transduction histidine kinase [Sulfurimonas sp.]|jgi:signal transduction histidine kinase|uniref:7TM diverse intracellular signaling domain-containing protein n=1 Tax=Sulfurimonas sp. TaxID=2022749 RepID=UPI0039E4401E
MLKLLVFLSFFTFLNASILELNYAQKKFENFTLSYLLDKNSNLTLQQVKEMQFKTINNKHAFNGHTGTSWYKIKFNNITDIKQKIYLHNNFAYFFKEISIFEVLDGTLFDQNKYNILDSSSENELTGSILIYETTVLPHSTKEIFLKNLPMVSNLLDLNIYDKKSSIDALIQSSIYSIMIVSIMLTLAFYNATLYFFNKRKEFLFYALYMITPAIGLTYKYGIIFRHFHLYGEDTYWLNLTAIVLNAFLALFLIQTLNTKILSKRIHNLLQSIIIFVSINILIAFFINLTFAIEVFKLIFVYTLLVMLYLSYYLFRVSHPLTKIFITAYSFYFTGMIITILAMSGVIELNFFTFHSGGIGLIMEGLFFSYLMHYNVKNLEREIRKQRDIIITKNKKAQIGEMVNAITHQWKQPISRVASITTLLEFQINQKTEISTIYLQDKISQINSNIFFLNDTIDDFKDFFNPNITGKKHSLEAIINKAVTLSLDDTVVKNISINVDINFNKKVKIHSNEILHILLNIIQNSKEAFKDNVRDSNMIKIIGFTKDNKTYIDIVDNAGGIDEETLPFIFNEYYTSKKDKSGSGLGLYLTKVILENHLKGSIEAKNIKDGAMFRIIL